MSNIEEVLEGWHTWEYWTRKKSILLAIRFLDEW